jgi:hypothetical protein
MSHFEAKTILTQSSIQQLISLHVVTCPSCHNDVQVEVLCECANCGALFCGMASNGCKAICPCDEYGTPYDDDGIYDEPKGSA